MEIYVLDQNRHLFIDDTLVERAADVRLVSNPPHKKGPVIVQDKPWRDRLTGYYGTVIDDGGIYKMWTNCGEGDVSDEGDGWGIRYGKNRYMQYLVSVDGLHWESPSLGLINFKGSRDNNLVRSVCNMEGTVFIDPRDTADRRYKFIFNLPRRGIHLLHSPDGLRWSEPESVFRHACDSQNVAFWDDRLGKYVCYFRGWEPEEKDPVTGEMTRMAARTVVRAEADSFAELKQYEGRLKEDGRTQYITNELPAVLRCDGLDPADTDIYTNAAVKYPLADDVYLAFPALYNKFGIDPAVDYRRMPNEGILETQLAVSRDGIRWNRVRRPYISSGPVGEIDSASIYTYTGMIIRETEIYQYYWGAQYTHGGQDIYAKWKGINQNATFIVSQRIDGFMSMDADYAGGSFTTRTFTFTGDRLVLNVNTSATGSARVELQNERGEPIEGFEMDACDVVKGNFINKTVSWNGNDRIGSLAGKPVKMRMVMSNTKLFSFRFES